MAVFNKDDQQEVHSRVTQTDKVSLLLDKLDRLDNPYDVLIEVLKQNKTEKHVIQFLERALRRMLEVEGKFITTDLKLLIACVCVCLF